MCLSSHLKCLSPHVAIGDKAGQHWSREYKSGILTSLTCFGGSILGKRPFLLLTWKNHFKSIQMWANHLVSFPEISLNPRQVLLPNQTFHSKFAFSNSCYLNFSDSNFSSESSDITLKIMSTWPPHPNLPVSDQNKFFFQYLGFLSKSKFQSKLKRKKFGENLISSFTFRKSLNTLFAAC